MIKFIIISDRERRLVDDITIPSGVRAVPTATELHTFCRLCQSEDLTLDVIYALLLEKLSSTRWQTRLVTIHIQSLSLSLSTVESENGNESSHTRTHTHTRERE